MLSQFFSLFAAEHTQAHFFNTKNTLFFKDDDQRSRSIHGFERGARRRIGREREEASRVDGRRRRVGHSRARRCEKFTHRDCFFFFITEFFFFDEREKCDLLLSRLRAPFDPSRRRNARGALVFASNERRGVKIFTLFCRTAFEEMGILARRLRACFVLIFLSLVLLSRERRKEARKARKKEETKHTI